MQSVRDTNRYLEMTVHHFNYTNFDGINLIVKFNFSLKKIKFPQMFNFEEKTNNLAYIKYQINKFKKMVTQGDVHGSDGKESAHNVGDLGSIPGLGRHPGEGNGNSLQYSCLENCMGRVAWWDIVHGVAKSCMQLND